MPAAFVVTAGGTPPLSYQWRFKDQEISGATGSRYTVEKVQLADCGDYSVTVTNAVGTLSSSNATLELGDLAGWGSAVFGEITLPLGAKNLLAISAGDYFSIFLHADRTVSAFGKNTVGQAICPPDLTNVISVATRALHSLALKADGTVVSWGYNLWSQTNVPTDLTNVVAVAAGWSHSLALLEDGTVRAWGGNVNNGYAETNVPAGLTNVVALAANSFSLALRGDGTVAGWGPSLPVIPADLTNVAAIDGGSFHGIGLLKNGTVRAWGASYAPTNVPADLTNVIAIAAGSMHNVALCADGRVVAWGQNDYGQATVPQLLSNVVAVAAGTSHNLALIGGPITLTTATLENTRLAGNSLVFSLPSNSGHVYALQYTESLTVPDWKTVRLYAGTGSTLEVSVQSTGASRFCRVLRW